eukprot:gene5134-6541_t
MLNRAALEVIRTGTKAYGVTKCCDAFDLSQDAGIGTFAWMYRLTHIYMPEIEINYEHSGYSVLSPALMAVHAVRHDPKTGETQQSVGRSLSRLYDGLCAFVASHLFPCDLHPDLTRLSTPLV